MTDTNVLAFPAKNLNFAASGTPPLWALFVLEDLKEHFVSAGQDEAAGAIMDSIHRLERILIPATG